MQVDNFPITGAMVELMEAQQPLLEAQQATYAQLQVGPLHRLSVPACTHVPAECGNTPSRLLLSSSAGPLMFTAHVPGVVVDVSSFCIQYSAFDTCHLWWRAALDLVLGSICRAQLD